MSKKPWDHTWKIVNSIGEGGQGLTSKVESKKDGQIRCMKRLKRNDLVERRERFRRGCVTLETLDHPHIPKYIDSNSEKFDLTEKLYLVTEYVEGKTLAKYRETNHVSQDDSVRLVIDLLKVLEYVHSRDVVHRDIKPENIIISENQPILVDFGLTFNEELASISTLSRDQIGNRFLHLPELQIESGDKRNPISDVTQTVGILLYLLSSYPPRILIDDEGNLPHQRSIIRNELSKMPSAFQAKIMPVFDRGFRQALSTRWQAASQLRIRIESILNPNTSGEDIDGVVDLASRIFASPEFSRRQQASEAFKDFEIMVKGVFARVLAEFEGQPISCSTNHVSDMPNLKYTRNQYLSVENFSEIRVLLRVSCAIVGNELIAQIQVENTNDLTDIGRILIDELPRDWLDIEKALRQQIFEVISQYILSQLPSA